jgi:hypothetical protein
MVSLPTTAPVKGLKPGELVHRLWLELAALDLAYSKLCLKQLDRRNRLSGETVVSPGGPVVSLTTYGKRIHTVYLTLETIARGALLPSRLILWMDDEAAFERRPDSLRRLETRGLEVKLTSNYGPHTKYYPYLISTEKLDVPLVTVDDDTLYPKRWLSSLAEGYKEHPHLIHCCRAHVVELEGEGFAPYISWQRCRSTVPNALNFATGVSGVIYPSAFQRKVKEAGLGFTVLCPKADDIWLHVQALRGGFKVKQLKTWEQSFPVMPGTQDMGLIQGNVHGSQNDVQIRRTYTAEDIARLRAAL